jgi:hypothetical protein
MKSLKWTQRSEALGEAADLLGSAETSSKDADSLRLGIIQLLDTANNDKAPLADESEGENQGEYYAYLIDRGLGPIIPGFFVCIDPSKLRRARQEPEATRQKSEGRYFYESGGPEA